jgi:hypothetical protein
MAKSHCPSVLGILSILSVMSVLKTIKDAKNGPKGQLSIHERLISLKMTSYLCVCFDEKSIINLAQFLKDIAEFSLVFSILNSTSIPLNLQDS